MIKICKACGKEYNGHHSQKYCDDCRVTVRKNQSRARWEWYSSEAQAQGKPVTVWLRERRRARPTERMTPQGKTLSDWAHEADECNMDYGNYRAAIAHGRTFDELKATAPTRRKPNHASSHHFIKAD